MTQSGVTSAVVDSMLGWLKGLARWVLRLFDLVGGTSPLEFLARNWLKLLIILMIIGVGVDILIYLIRWRPHWVWFRKKRVVINDNNFFAHEDDPAAYKRRPNRSGRPRRAWEDEEFVIPSTVAPRREAKRNQTRDIERAAEAREKTVHTDVFRDDLFNVNAKQKFSDKYEDEVFNVESLPSRRASARPNRRADGKGRKSEE